MDRDTESIGILEKPPPPTKELYSVTILLDLAGIALSFFIGPIFACLVLVYIGASKVYSYRGIRLKKYPVTGFLIVVLFQGAYTFLLVYYGCSDSQPVKIPWEGMLICTLLIGGFFPLTQIYQHRQDLRDGVTTISYKLGYTGTFIFCAISYLVAWLFISQYFISREEGDKLLMISILFIPVIVYFIKWFLQVIKDKSNANFTNTMRMTWLAATCTNIAFILLLIWNQFE